MTTITEALRAARACIQQDRASLADTGMRHDNTMEPDAAAGVAEYDAVLQQIDAALAGMTHHITDEQIDRIADDYDDDCGRIRVSKVFDFARAILALAAQQVEPYGWAVTGCHSLYRGEWAESTAQAEARRCGGTAVAFPLYTAPAPAVPSDAEIEANIWPALRLNGHPNLTLYDCIASIRAALTAAPTPPAQSEPKTADDDFLLGVCVALQTVTSMDCGVTWRQIVESVGVDDILYYAAWIEPEEWELAGFARYARRELRRGQPPKGRPPLRFAQPTQTAKPAVPEDVARDAERYRWLRDMASQDWLHRNHNYQNLRGAAFDAAIDAARKAGGAA